MFREQPISRAISEIETPSDLRSRRISAQSSTISTCFLPGSTPARVTGKLVNFQLPHRGQYSVAVDSDQLSRLVLVDSFGLSWNRTSPRFALPLLAYIARPTEQTRDRFLAQCFVDFDGLRGQLGERFEPIGEYALEWARTKTAKAALRHLMPGYGIRPIPRDVLMRITVPTTLLWGRHDLQTRLSVAEAASARYGWPLHVIEGARDDPFFEQPEAALHALRAALGNF